MHKNLEKFDYIRKYIGGCQNNEWSEFYSLQVKNKISISLWNKFNGLFGFSAYKRNLEKLVTDIFTEFCKGITYFSFEFQPLRHPVYHRNASCGSKEQTVHQKFTRTLYGPNKAKYVKRCFIERRVYDQIYKRILGYQDVGHLLELEYVGRYADEYYPRHNYSVKLEFDPVNTKYPVTAFVIYVENSAVIIDSYTKTLDLTHRLFYAPTVYCERRKDNTPIASKTQDFDHHNTWVPAP